MGCCQSSNDEPAVAQSAADEVTKPGKSLSRSNSSINKNIDDFLQPRESKSRMQSSPKMKQKKASATTAETIELASFRSPSSSATNFGCAARRPSTPEASTVAQPIKCSGWLLKKGQGKGFLSRRNWKKRFFVLEGQTLQYFAKRGTDGSGKELKGELEIMSTSILPIRKVDGAKYDAMFDIIQRHPCIRVIHLRAPNGESDLNMWMEAVTNL